MDPRDRARWSRTNRALVCVNKSRISFQALRKSCSRSEMSNSAQFLPGHPDGVFPTNSGEFVGTARSNDSPNVNARSLNGVIRNAAATAAPSPSRSSTRADARLPGQCRRMPARARRTSSRCGFSGASSAGSDRYLFGNDSLAIVRHALPYCTSSEPGVRQVIFVAHLAHPHRDLGQPVARQIRYS